MKRYSILVFNRQGASTGTTVNSKREASRWLAGWADPQNLSVTVKELLPDGPGHIVGRKPFGRKRIEWYGQ